MDMLILLGRFFALMAIGVPMAYSLGLAALVGAVYIDIPLDAVMIQIASGVNKFSLLAIPFFVLAGAIMAEGGMSRRLVAFASVLVGFASVLVGFIRGGLSLVNILASTFFGGISGSSVADTASIGSVLIMAGILPGLLTGLVLAALGLWTAHREGYPKGDVIPLRQALKICVEALWGLMTLVIILGGNLSGVFTGACQATCRLVHAASGCLSMPFKCALMMASRSGLSVTTSTGSQLRVWPDQRAGLAALASEYSPVRARCLANAGVRPRCT